MNRSSYGEKEINMKRSHDIVSGDSDSFSSSNHVVSDSSPSGSGIASSPDIKKRIKLEADPHGTSADSRAGLPALAGRRWYQGTEYKCRVCSEVLFGSKSLLNHLQVQHQMASAEYLELVKQLGTKESYYVCQVCQKPLEHTLTVISR